MSAKFDAQFEPGEGSDGKLAGVTLDDLIREIKARCEAVMILAIPDTFDEDDKGRYIIFHQGPRLFLIGALEDAKHNLIAQNNDDS